jgi:uncharacterized protein (DUF1919 family)
MKHTFIERLFHKMDEKTRKYRAPFMRKKLQKTDFTIISNNCWGGVVYEAYGLPKNSPTIGGYFFADDYIKFCSNLRHYLSVDIKMITSKESKHRASIIALGKTNEDAPIGLIDDVEFVFLHYKTPEIAKEKWIRRISRVNFDNLIFKFSFQNECTENHLKQFEELDLPGKKIMFVHKPDLMGNVTVYYPGDEKESQLPNDTFYWNKFFDVTAFLNGEGIKKRTELK